MAAGPTYTPIATTTLGSAASSVTFSSISGSYTDLIIVVNPQLASGVGNTNLTMRVNSDTGTNYSWTRLTGDGSSAGSDRASNYSSMILCNAGYMNNAAPSSYIIHVMNYSNTSTYKTVINRANLASVGTDAVVNLWRSTAAINNIQLYAQSGGNMASGSTFTLYGVKSA